MGHPTIADKVFDYFNANKNLHINITEIAENVGFTVAQVLTAIGNLRNRGNVPIYTAVAGRVFMYSPIPGREIPKSTVADNKSGTKARGELFEYLATLKDGMLLLQGENGNIYRAEKL